VVIEREFSFNYHLPLAAYHYYEQRPLLRMQKIRKVFSGVVALDSVNLTLERGEVHSLVGENGAGKSTLIKIMTGAYNRDGGEMFSRRFAC
jgi:ABC-type sugar transport system ATPase subunit